MPQVLVGVHAQAIAKGLGLCALLSCMPLGQAPEGQQLIHERSLTRPFFSPSGSDSVPPYLWLLGPRRGGRQASPSSPSDQPVIPSDQSVVTDLYQIPYGAGVGPAARLDQRTPAVRNLSMDSPMASGMSMGTYPNDPNGALVTDSEGRLFLLVTADEPQPSGEVSWELERYQPSSGAAEAIARIDQPGETLLLSPGRTRLFEGGGSSGVLVDLHGTTLLGSSNNPLFLGEDLYYVSATPSGSPASAPVEFSLHRIKPNAEPELLLSLAGYFSYQAIQGDRAPQLLISTSGGGPSSVPPVLLDTQTLAVTPLPSDFSLAQFLSASPGGHCLLFQATSPPTDPQQQSEIHFLLFDWTTGKIAQLAPDEGGQAGWSSPEWPPGHEEVWLQADIQVTIWKPDGSLSTVQANLRSLSRGVNMADWSIFTADGMHWFGVGSGQHPSMVAGSVDDPTLPPVRLNPEGTSCYSYWSLGGDELLVSTYTDDSQRQDFYRVDLATGASRVLLGGGQVVALGRTRALALLDWESWRSAGNLALVDLETGENTLLAENVTMAIVAPGNSAEPDPAHDPLAPGTKVAFVYRNRLASPYDGLWVTELP